MKKADVKKIEEDILKITSHHLEIKFAGSSLQYDSPSFYRSGNCTEYCSEIRSYIYKNGEIVDAIEFFVFLDGKLSANKEEIELWLQTTIDDILILNN